MTRAPFFLALVVLAVLPVCGGTREPLFSAVGGAAWETPYHAARFSGDYGWRGGMAYSTSLSTGELELPVEIGLMLRTAVLKSTDYYDRTVFTDVQAPVIFHGALFHQSRLEILALWVPSYTLDMVSSGPDGGSIAYTRALRTRFNMGFGGGLQVSTFMGIRLRSYWVYNIFSAFPASQLTFSDLGAELAVPFKWKKAGP